MSGNPNKKQIEQAFKRAAGMAAANEPDVRSGRYRVATVYFVREGSGDERTNQGEEFSLDEIVKAFPRARTTWSSAAPVFDPERPVNPYSGYRYVVVHVRGAEPVGQFRKDGYWTLDEITPDTFKSRLSLTVA